MLSWKGKSSFKLKNIISTSKPLEILHMDLCGPMITYSLRRKSYTYINVDYFSRFIWTIFLRNKDCTFDEFIKFWKKIKNEKGLEISNIRSDHGKEIENIHFKPFCDEHGISHNFLTPRTL